MTRESDNTQFDFFRVDGLTWIEWAGVLGLILTVVGFGVAWWQLWRLRTASEAVDAHVHETNREAAVGRLSDSVPRLRRSYNSASKAARENRKGETQADFESWTSVCSKLVQQVSVAATEVHGRRRVEVEADADALVRRLRMAQSKVDDSIFVLRGADCHDVSDATRYALHAMRLACDECDAWLERSKYHRKAS
jgi:hypothetical protein